MTNSESLLQFGNNAYAKPATALNILRETVLGRELFDFAFKEYARALEVQAADARRLLPHDGGRLGRRPRLVLARLVLHDRPRRTSRSSACASTRSTRATPTSKRSARRQERAARPADALAAAQQAPAEARRRSSPALKDFYNTYDEFGRHRARPRGVSEVPLQTLTEQERALLAAGHQLLRRRLQKHRRARDARHPAHRVRGRHEGRPCASRPRSGAINNAQVSKLIVTTKEIEVASRSTRIWRRPTSTSPTTTSRAGPSRRASSSSRRAEAEPDATARAQAARRRAARPDADAAVAL